MNDTMNRPLVIAIIFLLLALALWNILTLVHHSHTTIADSTGLGQEIIGYLRSAIRS